MQLLLLAFSRSLQASLGWVCEYAAHVIRPLHIL
jgi:hypothetical protein